MKNPETKLMRATFAILGLALVLGGTLFAQNDSVVLAKDGAKQAGKVTDYDFDAIKISLTGGASTTLKPAEVRSVDLDLQSKEMKAADAAYTTGRDEDAVNGFQEILNAKKVRKVLRQEAFYKMAQSQLKLGKYDDAVATFKSMIADGEFPRSRYLAQIHDQVCGALAAAGKTEEIAGFASGEVARLSKYPEAAGMVEHLNLLQGRALVAKGDPSAMAVVSKIAGGTGPAAGEAKVLLGDLAMNAKDTAKAEKLYREALASNTSRMAKAAAHNGIGDIQLAAGVAQKKTEILDEALLSFLWGHVLYAPAEGEPTRTHEESMLKAGTCFQYLGDLEKDKDAQTKKYLKARELFRKVLALYPTSPSAAEAKTRLEKIGG